MAGPFSRLFGRREQRRELGPGGWPVGYVGSTGSGPVSPREAEGLSAVVACVELICGAISSLPASLVIDTAAGQAPAPPTAPAWRILSRPNPHQSWPAFANWATAQYLLHGNSVAWIQTDLRGAVSGLMPVPWLWLMPQVIAGADGARLVYDVVQSSPDAAALGLPKRLLDSDVMHIRARSDHGLIGRSVLSRAPDPLREGLEISRLALANWQNGMRPSAIMSAPAYLGDAQRTRFDDAWMAKFTGSLAAGRVPLLEGGWKLERAALSSVDAQFAEMRGLSTAEASRLFGVPEQLIAPGPRAIADLAPYTTAFAQHCLAPIVAAITAEFGHAVLQPGMHLQLDLDGLARGSFSATVAALAALVQAGVITANDARTELGWSPRADGDVLRVGGAPAWPADGEGLPSLSPKPGPRGDAPPAPGTHMNKGRMNGQAVMQ